jgi:hypothetical protein
MSKPRSLKVGQIWTLQFFNDYKVLWRVESISDEGVIFKIIESDNCSYIVGASSNYQIVNILSKDRWICVSPTIKTSNRKRPKLSIVMCRACGDNFPWIKGTSKKNYVCLPCRKSYGEA